MASTHTSQPGVLPVIGPMTESSVILLACYFVAGLILSAMSMGLYNRNPATLGGWLRLFLYAAIWPVPELYRILRRN